VFQAHTRMPPVVIEAVPTSVVSFHYRVTKRAFDILLTAILLVVALPLMGLVALLVLLDSGGPVLFRQKRLGQYGEVFDCLKFRTMCVDAEQQLEEDAELLRLYRKNNFKLPVEHDHRLTRVGRVLRKTSLDELPQLFHVLSGRMSLVGPRPIVREELRHYDTRRHIFLAAKPGIAGAWQANGRSRIAYPERATIDVDYVKTWSFRQDVELLLRTAVAVLTGRGAH